jgi:NADPH:quinone reductase-like Zn-dependent oxidoreductase
VELLREHGAEIVLNSSDEGFDEEFEKLARELNATVCFEAIAGDMPGRIIKLMPPRSIVHVYGALSGQHVNSIEPVDFLFSGKEIKGLLMPNYLEKFSMFKQLMIMRNISRNLETSFKTEI